MNLSKTLNALAHATEQQFREKLARPPRWLAAAPGRVNLIGEHTDYNGGYVLPMAIERYVVIAADRPRGPAGKARFFSTAVDEWAEILLDGELRPGPIGWANYVEGVVAGCFELGMKPGGLDVIVHSNVPLGGGLSSSAALEVATATLLEAVTGRSLDPIQKALLCQKAEHTFAGMPCGIMDQFTSVLGKEDALMLLDCRSQKTEMVPLTDPEVTVLITNSNVKHELTGTEYASRRAQCEETAKTLHVDTLRDVTVVQLEQSKYLLEPAQYRRARHVVSEIERTVAAAVALREGDWAEVGRLMYASHASLRDDFDVSCEELNLLVEIAESLGSSAGVIGSRMTGGGFGGCTVSLVRSEAVGKVSRVLHERYKAKTGIAPTIFATRPAGGARVLTDFKG